MRAWDRIVYALRKTAIIFLPFIVCGWIGFASSRVHDPILLALTLVTPFVFVYGASIAVEVLKDNDRSTT